MIEVRHTVIDKYIELMRLRHERRIQDIIDITDQEVMERLGVEEDDIIETDVLYKHFTDKRESFFALTGFTIDEFDKLWPHVEQKLSSPGKGRKSKISPKDILIIILHYLRRYPRVEEQASIFSLKPSTLQNIISKYLPLMAQALKHDFIDVIAEEELVYAQNFPECAFVVDATVQEINKPSLSFDSAKEYFITHMEGSLFCKFSYS